MTSSSSSAEMREYCKQQFMILAPIETSNAAKKETGESKVILHAKMLDYMQRNGISNMQLAPNGDAGSGEPTLQVVISKYYNPKPLKEEVIREARINWNELVKPSRSPADQVAHIFKEIQNARKQSTPMVKVQPCGRLNRTRLAFVEPDTKLFKMALDYTEMQQKIKQLKTRVTDLKQTQDMARLEACALDELKRAKLKRRIYNIKGAQYVVKVATRTTTKKPTVKQLKECIRIVVMEGALDKRTFYAKLMRLLGTANAPETKESVVFEKVKLKPVNRSRSTGQGETSEQRNTGSVSRSQSSISGGSRRGSRSVAPIGGSGTGLLISRKSQMEPKRPRR